ncbi:MAG: bifunctional DNA-formamidopyrimidine glycosylase/DNA-(apurinic or apyrimidinic site) lyase [Alphaproteobacteria bacterium]|jgi:formamidopyrimidine-DNA glycosylase|nr:bifunctional DNA-formamidopyrimidine glycosylase/DNA-(apurinic or apyrimidinic site) lyase [Alphaproteobacteria bacterium]
MPELPEVETVLTGMKEFLLGQTIRDVKIFSPKLRNIIPKNLRKVVVNQRVLAMSRRAKYMLWTLENDQTIIIHFGMTGVFRTRVRPNEKYHPEKHDHVWFELEDGTELIYRDPRRFGVMDLCPNAQLEQSCYLNHLGYEPLDRSFSGRSLFDQIQRRKIAIKQAIMDQKLVVGVGNIYASESLFLAQIDPDRAANQLTYEEAVRLVSAIKKILKRAIRAGGSTLRDYRRIGGERGHFQASFSVYDREGQPCPDCQCDVKKTGGIKRIVQGNRSTFYCPTKQR